MSGVLPGILMQQLLSAFESPVLSGQSYDYFSAQLQWGLVPGAIGYRLEYSLDSGSSWATAAELGDSTVQYVHRLGPPVNLLTKAEAWWDCDEDGNVTRADQLNGHDLSIVNSVASRAGIIGNGMDFNGSDYIATPGGWPTGTGSFAVAMYVYFDSKSGNDWLMARCNSGNSIAGDWACWTNTDGIIRFFICSDGQFNDWDGTYVQATTPILSGEGGWVYFHYDSLTDEIAVSVNNEELVTNTVTHAFYTAGNQLRLGEMNPSYPHGLDGMVDAVQYFNEPLTAQERTWLFNDGACRQFNDTGGNPPYVADYRIRALFPDDEESSPSNVVIVTTHLPAPITTATPIDADTIRIDIEPVEGAEEYEIQVSNDGGLSWADATTLTLGVVEYEHNIVGGTPPYTRQYRSRAIDGVNESVWSIPVTVNTVTPGAPIIDAFGLDETSIQIDWDLITDATNYRLLESSDGGSTWDVIAVTDDVTDSYVRIPEPKYTLTIQDTFTDASNTLLPDHTPDVDLIGDGWDADSNVFIRLDTWNAAGTTTTGVAKHAWINAGSPDVRIFALTSPTGASAYRNVGPLLRYQDNNNYWFCGINTFTTSPWTWGIIKVEGGVLTLEASAQGIDGGSTNRFLAVPVEVYADGDDIRFIVPNQNIDLSVTDSFLNDQTHHGFRASTSNSSYFTAIDDFEIYVKEEKPYTRDYQLIALNGEIESAPSNVDSATPAPTVWEYATLAAAEASGDSWGNADIIRITDPDPDVDFIYRASLAVVGHSGLIHADPFGDSTEFDSVTVLAAQGATDPATWAGWVNDPAWQTTTVDGDKFKLATTNNTDKHLAYPYTLTSAMTDTFAICRGFEAYGTGNYNLAHVALTAYIDGSDICLGSFGFYNGVSASNYVSRESASYADAGVAIGTVVELFVYCRNGEVAVWDGESLIGIFDGQITAPYYPTKPFRFSGVQWSGAQPTLEAKNVIHGYLT